MSVPRVLRKFSKVSASVDRYNSKNRVKRFYSMTHHHHGKTTEVGIYDGQRKKYIVTDVRAYNAFELVEEMQAYMERA